MTNGKFYRYHVPEAIQQQSITSIPEFELLRGGERFSVLEIPAKLLNGIPMVTWRTVIKSLPRTISSLSTRFPLRHLS
jgi:hypothetical protein